MKKKHLAVTLFTVIFSLTACVHSRVQNPFVVLGSEDFTAVTNSQNIFIGDLGKARRYGKELGEIEHCQKSRVCLTCVNLDLDGNETPGFLLHGAAKFFTHPRAFLLKTQAIACSYGPRQAKTKEEFLTDTYLNLIKSDKIFGEYKIYARMKNILYNKDAKLLAVVSVNQRGYTVMPCSADLSECSRHYTEKNMSKFASVRIYSVDSQVAEKLQTINAQTNFKPAAWQAIKNLTFDGLGVNYDELLEVLDTDKFELKEVSADVYNSFPSYAKIKNLNSTGRFNENLVKQFIREFVSYGGK